MATRKKSTDTDPAPETASPTSDSDAPVTPTPEEAAPNAVTEADVREQSTEDQTDAAEHPENAPAASTKLAIGDKVQFQPDGRDDVATATVSGLGSDDDNVLLQWNGQEAWVPTKGITTLQS